MSSWFLLIRGKVTFLPPGNGKLTSNKSMEIYSGDKATENDDAIVVEAIRNVHIKSQHNGNLILEGANVIIKATDADGDISFSHQKL